MADDEAALCICIFFLAVAGFVIMTLSSPIFVLYGFFSNEWLVQDLQKEPSTGSSNVYRQTARPPDDDNKIYYGLYKKCFQRNCTAEILDETTFGLEVTSVTFLFLAILSLPWLKYWHPDSTVLKHWNRCFVPFLLISAIMSLAGGTYFSSIYGSHEDNDYGSHEDNDKSTTPALTVGQSQVMAGLGGGFQIVLALVIGAFVLKSISDNDDRGTSSRHHSSRVAQSQVYILRFFYYESPPSQTRVTTIQVQESQEQAERY